jgi:hypothetical protein
MQSSCGTAKKFTRPRFFFRGSASTIKKKFFFLMADVDPRKKSGSSKFFFLTGTHSVSSSSSSSSSSFSHLLPFLSVSLYGGRDDYTWGCVCVCACVRVCVASGPRRSMGGASAHDAAYTRTLRTHTHGVHICAPRSSLSARSSERVTDSASRHDCT